MRFLPVRDDALLIELDDLTATLALFDALSRSALPGVGELVPGARTILVPYEPRLITPHQIVLAATEAAHVAAHSGMSAITDPASTDPASTRRGTDPASIDPARRGTLIEIPVRYDGQDLDEVASLLGLTPREVVALHAGSDYTVAFTGFAPGFAYLAGGDPALNVPRRQTPRPRIPAGSVGLAGTFSGVYPRESPGGWKLIGTTDTPMWDLARTRPALLVPGDRVRFVEVGAPARNSRTPASVVTPRVVSAPRVVPAPAPAPRVAPASAPAPTPALDILDPGMLTLLQDLGRPGLASMGVSASGALDRPALRDANRIVGNDTATACLELTFGGVRLRALGSQMLAVSGAAVPLTIIRADGHTTSVPLGTAFALDHYDELHIGTPTDGVRSYLAVRGGFDLEPVLGSLSTDILAGLGPAPIAAGTVLPIRPILHGGAVIEIREHSQADVTVPTVEPGEVTLDVVLGPRADWFSADAVRLFAAQAWTVSARSNRVGLRLEGIPLERLHYGELPSEATVTGAIQIPPDGQPVLFLADHPLTGGYPVIGAVTTGHLARAGQLPPGANVRFVPRGPFEEYR